jgi:hypothetical protein
VPVEVAPTGAPAAPLAPPPLQPAEEGFGLRIVPAG